MTIADFIGLTYENKGRTLKGVDCYGLYILFNKLILNKTIPEYGYAHAEDANAVHCAFTYNERKWIDVTDAPQLGDLIMFKIAGRVVHCGVYINKSEFLHTLAGRNCTIEPLDSVTWVRRKYKVIRWQT